jgi:uncharacterized protein (UPF0335 family)
LYYTINDNFNDLLEYFQPLGYELVQGDGYYIFYIESAINEKAIGDRLERLEETMRLIDLFRGVLGDFCVGLLLTPSDLEIGIRGNVVYLERLGKIRSIKHSESLSDTCRDIFKELRERGILARSAEDMDKHVVTSAYNYIQDFIEAIERIEEDDLNEGDEDE